MNPIYQKLRTAAITPEEFLSGVNVTQLNRAAILGCTDSEARTLALPPVMTIAERDGVRIRLLSGPAFSRQSAAAAAHVHPTHVHLTDVHLTDVHLIYPLEGDVVALDGQGGSMRIGPLEPITVAGDIVHLQSLDHTATLVLELYFGAKDAEAGFAPTQAASGAAVIPPNSYYWDFEERYVQAYGQGGDSWETLEPNRALEPFINEYGSALRDIIDLGTGEGRDAIYLAELGYTVTGIDVAPSGLAKAQALAQSRGVAPVFLQRDVVHLRGFADNSFDAALNMGCLHLIDVPEQRARHLQRVFEILRPGGLFLLGHCRSDWLKGFWSVDDFDAVKDCKVGTLIKTRVRKAGGGSFVTDMPILRHAAKDDQSLAAELRAAGFEAAGEYDARTLSDLGNVSVLLVRKPLAGHVERAGNECA